MTKKETAKRSQRILKKKQDKSIKKLNPNESKKEQSPELPKIEFSEQMTRNNKDDVKSNNMTDNLQRNEEDEWDEWMKPCSEDNSDHTSVNTIVNDVIQALKVEQKHFTRAKVRVHFQQ